MRRELFALHLPNPERVEADYAVLAELSRGLSGGDILNICVNAIHAGSVDADPAKWKVTQGMIERKTEGVEDIQRSIFIVSEGYLKLPIRTTPFFLNSSSCWMNFNSPSVVA